MPGSPSAPRSGPAASPRDPPHLDLTSTTPPLRPVAAPTLPPLPSLPPGVVNLQSLANLMEEFVPGQWAFTGGQAISLYEKIYALPRTRASHDVDVVVPKALVREVAQKLVSHFQTGSAVSLKAAQVEVSGVLVNNGVDIVKTHLDILSSAEFSQDWASVQHHLYHQHAGEMRLLPPSQMLKRKNEQLRDLNFQAKSRGDDAVLTKFENAKRDVQALELIVAEINATSPAGVPYAVVSAPAAASSSSAGAEPDALSL